MDDTRPPQPGHDGSGPGPDDEHRAGLRHAASSTREAARTTARATARVGQATRLRIRRATNAQGAGESGLAKLTELSGVNAAADALIAVSLAGSLFFSVPIGEARGRVALYLIITMVPFALLAPLIGPLLDKFRSGRRYALAVTFGLRAFLAWSMVGSVNDADLWLYPAVFGVLVCSRAYNVTRAACVPRLLPPSVPLVRANSWMNMAGLFAAAVAGGLGIVLTHVLGAPWALRAAAIIFIVGAVLSIRLPKRIDSAVDEKRATLTAENVAAAAKEAVTHPGSLLAGVPKVRAYVGPAVEMGLRANMAFRAVSGFVTLFLAFLLRQEPIGDLSDTTAIGLVIGAAGVGSVLGTSVGAFVRERAPEGMLVLLLAAETVALLLAATWWGLIAVLIAGFVVGFAQTLGKLALDAMIQRDVDEDVRTSAFARSETWLQMAWVSGGALGIGLPLRGDVGFGIASGALLVLTAMVLQGAVANRRARRGAEARPAAPAKGGAPRKADPFTKPTRPAPPPEQRAAEPEPHEQTHPYDRPHDRPRDPGPYDQAADPRNETRPVPRSGPLHPGFDQAAKPSIPFPPTQYPPTQYPPAE